MYTLGAAGVNRGYTLFMLELAQDKAAHDECPACGTRVPVGVLQTCMICRSLFCRRCAVPGYGRSFCSPVCRDYFFHGDGDDDVGEA